MRFMRDMGSIGLLCFFLVLGCGDPDVSEGDRLASAVAYDSLLQELPDSLRRAMPAIDSLFLAHGAGGTAFPPVDSLEAARWVDSLMASLSLEEKIGQMFIVHLDPQRFAGLVDDASDAVRDLNIGGFLVPRLLEAEQVFEETQRLQRMAKVPLFFAADYERGVGRFNNALTELPSNMALGATRDTLLAAAAGRLTAIEARAIGINLLFAPVVDVNNNPDNPIINIRSYGEDPELVGHMAAAFVHEAQGRGLLTTLKHFPGHGDTEVDTHSRMGVVQGDRASLEDVELKPYRILFDRRTQPAAVMSAHLWIEALEEDPLPATFSGKVLEGMLRQDMGFDGIVITDDVRMGALQQDYTVEDRIVRPLRAGANVILTPANAARALTIVRRAVESGRLSAEALDTSIRRILWTKARAGLHRDPFAVKARFDELMEKPLGAYIAQAIADRSITLLKTTDILPLQPDSQRITTVHLTNYQGAPSIQAAMNLFDETLGVASARFDEEPSVRDIERVIQSAGDADVIVLALYLRLVAGRGEAGLFARQSELANRLLALEKPVVLLTFGNPYAASTFREADGIVVAYDQSLQTVYATLRVLLGEQPALGRLPITVEPFDFGSGMDWVGR